VVVEPERVFPDDERESHPTSFKFLQMAHAWKNAQSKKTTTGGSEKAPVLSGFTAASRSMGDASAEEDARSDVASSHGGDEGE
jgi:crooked neck